MIFDFNDLNVIAKVTDEDFGLTPQPLVDPQTRLGARGIIFDEDNNIAVLFKENKNEYKLPGGGIEENEDAKFAFLREAEEEAGCEIEIKNFLGNVIEEKSKENFTQLSFVFVASKTKDLSGTNLTEQEKQEDAKILWMKPQEALEKMKSCLNHLKASAFDSVYRTEFMVKRDIKILEYFLNNKDKF